MLRGLLGSIVLLYAAPASAQLLAQTFDRTPVPAALGPAQGRHYSVHTARGPAQTLEVWLDNIAYRPLAQLRDDDGSLIRLPPLGRGAATGAAFDGTRYLVVTYEWTSSTRVIHGFFITPAGIVSPGFDVIVEPTLGPASIAYANGNYLCAFTRFYQGNSYLDGRVIDPQGQVSPAPDVNAIYATLPHVASDGSGFLVGWDDLFMEMTSIRTFDSNGAATSNQRWPRFELLPDTLVRDRQNDVLWNDGRWYLSFIASVWDGMAWSPPSASVLRLEGDGTIVDPEPIAMGGPGPNDFLHYPHMAAFGSDVYVTWVVTNYQSGEGNIDYGARLSADGQASPSVKLTPEGLADDPGARAVLTPDGLYAYYAATYRPEVTHDEQIFRRLLDADLNPGERTLVSTWDIPQQQPAQVALGVGALLAWVDTRSYRPQVYAARLDAAGATRDGSGVALAEADVEQVRPRLAAGPDGAVLAVWHEAKQRYGYDENNQFAIRAALLADAPGGLSVTSFDLVALGGGGIVRHPAIAARADGYFAAWVKREGDGAYVWGTHISPTGEVTTPGGALLFPDEVAAAMPLTLVATDTGYAIGYRALTPNLYARRLGETPAVWLGNSVQYNTPVLTYSGERLLAATSDLNNIYMIELSGEPLMPSPFSSAAQKGAFNLAFTPLPGGELLLGWQAAQQAYVAAMCKGSSILSAPLVIPAHTGTALSVVGGEAQVLVVMGERVHALGLGITGCPAATAPPVPGAIPGPGQEPQPEPQPETELQPEVQPGAEPDSATTMGARTAPSPNPSPTPSLIALGGGGCHCRSASPDLSFLLVLLVLRRRAAGHRVHKSLR